MLKPLRNCSQKTLTTIGLILWSSEESPSITWAFIRDANYQVGGDSNLCFHQLEDESGVLNVKGRNLWLSKPLCSLVTLITDFFKNNTSLP